MKTLKTLKAQLLAEPNTRAAYDAQAEEFAIGPAFVDTFITGAGRHQFMRGGCAGK